VITGERPLLHKDGSARWIENVIVNLALGAECAGLGHASAGRHRAQTGRDGAADSEERFRTLVQFSFDVYWESDAQHRFTRQEFAEDLADAPVPGLRHRYR